jgi:hypothetical protein
MLANGQISAKVKRNPATSVGCRRSGEGAINQELNLFGNKWRAVTRGQMGDELKFSGLLHNKLGQGIGSHDRSCQWQDRELSDTASRLNARGASKCDLDLVVPGRQIPVE